MASCQSMAKRNFQVHRLHMSSNKDQFEPTRSGSTEPSQSDAGAETTGAASSAGAADDAAIEEMAAQVLAQPATSEPAAGAIIDAEAVESEDAVAEIVTAEAVGDFNAPPVSYGLGANHDQQLDTGIYADPVVPAAFNQLNMQTKGGAIGGVLLGLLSIGGAWLTGYSIINAALGLMLSCWGLRSSARQWAGAGIALSLVGRGTFIIVPPMSHHGA